MTLRHKSMTPKALAANRANALLSTGPRSQEGKLHSRLNGLEHGIFTQALGASIRELGEDPAAYESLRRGLLRAFTPEDGFEEMLVEEMAQLSWRRQRLMRAESGLVAAKKRHYEISRALEGSSQAGGSAQFAEATMIPVTGYAGLPDSVDKCDHILDALRSLRQAVLAVGPTQEHAEILDLVYGKPGPLGGIDLKARYRQALKWAQTDKQKNNEDELESFLTALDKEIDAYVELRKLCKARDLETTQTMKDAQLLPSAEELARILSYERSLARQFKSKLKQLVGWRRAKKGMLPSDAAAPETQTEEPEAESTPENNLALLPADEAMAQRT
jgi:hypothetical protein